MLEDDEWVKENLKENIIKFFKIEHNTANFIDDSNSVIKFEDPSEATTYIDRFLKVLKIYYNNQTLKVNADITSLLVIAKPKHQDYKEEIRIEDEK